MNNQSKSLNTKILIVDDHPTFIEGVSVILQSIIPNTIPLSSLNGKDALKTININPDIEWIFLDINLPDYNGIELLEHFEKNRVLANIIIMTSANDPSIIDEVLKHHAAGFLTKDFNRQILADCIKTVEMGNIFLTTDHEKQLRNYRESLLREKQIIEDNLSERQKQTLLLIVKGYSNREIAESLGISESTVKTHVSSLISLFEADNRTHCVAEARRLQIVS